MTEKIKFGKYTRDGWGDCQQSVFFKGKNIGYLFKEEGMIEVGGSTELEEMTDCLNFGKTFKQAREIITESLTDK